MACDHLDKRTFDNAMEEIKTNYKSVVKEYNDGFTTAMTLYYAAWQSKKGYEKTNALYKSFCSAINTAGTRINKHYDAMREGAVAYAKSQDMWLWIGNLDKTDVESASSTFRDEQEIIINENKIKSAGECLKTSLKKMSGYIKAMTDITKSDKSFGYYTEGDVNHRALLNDAFEKLSASLDKATENFTHEFDTTLSEDKAARDAAKQSSAVEASDVDDIF